MDNNTTVPTLKALHTIRVNDYRPFDYDSGRRMALPREALVPCDCCGKLCAVTHTMSNGLEVGRECATLLERPSYWPLFGLRAKQLAHLTAAISR